MLYIIHVLNMWACIRRDQNKRWKTNIQRFAAPTSKCYLRSSYNQLKKEQFIGKTLNKR